MDSGQLFNWKLRPTLGMDLGQPPPPPKRLRPTLQLKIKANSWNEFRPPPPKRLRPTLQLKIKANSWNEFRPTLPPEGLRPTLQLKIKANSWNGFRPTPPPPPGFRFGRSPRVQLTNVVRFSCQSTNLEWPQKSPFTEWRRLKNRYVITLDLLGKYDVVGHYSRFAARILANLPQYDVTLLCYMPQLYCMQAFNCSLSGSGTASLCSICLCRLAAFNSYCTKKLLQG